MASLLSYHVDALILSDSLHTPRTRKMIATAGIPVVETMDLPEQPIDLVVGMDHRAAARAMVTEMLSRGRRRPIYLGARLDVRTRLRMEGYYQAMAEANLPGRHLLTERASSFALEGNCWSRPWPSIRISMASTAPTTISRSAPCCAARHWA
ncbi:DNA-binding LacI/PurR family transcriptional regulator [Aeromonas sp. BIGb0405]|nr:DNA-binding LacI/PurR family transcriptional regulator [Aeromonas sp. BIGb0405]